MLKMGDRQHFWRVMLYYFKKGKNATEMQKKVCAVYGEGAVTDGMCQKRFDILSKYFFAAGLSDALEDVQQQPWPLPTRSQ